MSALLLLHGLHPQDLPTPRARMRSKKMRPLLGAQGIQIELIDAAKKRWRVQVCGRLQGKHNTVAELQQEIERAIFEAAPEAMRVEIAGLPEVNVHELRFVPNACTRCNEPDRGRRAMNPPRYGAAGSRVCAISCAKADDAVASCAACRFCPIIPICSKSANVSWYCCCRACALLFGSQQGARYRPVPRDSALS